MSMNATQRNATQRNATQRNAKGVLCSNTKYIDMLNPKYRELTHDI